MIIKLAWRNLWRNRLRTGIMISAMVFGLVGVVVLMGFLSGMYANMIDNAIAWQTSHLQVQRSSYIDTPDIKDTLVAPAPLLEYLDQLPEVAATSGRYLAEGMVASARATRGVRINGIDADREAAVTPIAGHILQGQWLDDQGRHPVVVSRKTAQRLQLTIGSKVVLTFTDAQGEVSGAAFRVRGLYHTPSSTFDDNNLFVRIEDLQALAGGQGVHEIAVRLVDNDYRQIAALQALRDRLQQHTAPDNRVRDWQQIQPLLASILAQSGTSNAIILAIYVVAMGFGIINIMLMSVFERTREFGVLMAVGMQKHKVFSLIIAESTLLGGCGGLIGVGVSMAVIALLSYTGIPLGDLAEGLNAFGVDTLLYPHVTPTEYGFIFLTVVGASLLAALYPARHILKQRPVDAMAEKH
ncbi:ABC-type transport system, involved in lipoprotein release, permease component [Ferrimonas sediminum]|uniref:ABC-type transport system, involved in lipoprotein release, permease component n=1 Tax=Ferrimonas sediminum TaxID=718193 RepID=A0A1G8VS72_9GAMM|nr:FtsX-like permease family protein [Ferrimonas sediminum]SDJ68050.1 ABC-type transport system, involved in lipoprotein release, permease component [Ferrimonas sediminum]